MADHGLSSKHNRKKMEEPLAFALVDVIALRTLTEGEVKPSSPLRIRGQLTHGTVKVRQEVSLEWGYKPGSNSG